MDIRRTAYWTTTVLTAFVFLSGGIAYLGRAEFALSGIVALGYPAYFFDILGTWKVLCGPAILAPRLPRLKEWAYAGITFDLTRAAASHLATGHPAAQALVPLAILGIAAASWVLRLVDRRVG